jgi:hypothetical protein
LGAPGDSSGKRGGLKQRIRLSTKESDVDYQSFRCRTLRRIVGPRLPAHYKGRWRAVSPRPSLVGREKCSPRRIDTAMLAEE